MLQFMFANYEWGYVRGDVFPMIQKMERFTKNATKLDSNTRPWVSRWKDSKKGEREEGRGREKTAITDTDKRGLVPRI